LNDASAPPAPPLPRGVLAAAGLLFFLSGATALVYQVVWQRLLALQSGVGIYSIAMIVAAFLLGLGFGAHLGGALSARFGARGALFGFAGAELAIGAFGASSAGIYYDWIGPRATWLYEPAWRAGLVHLASLLPPTLLMGMTLPLLVRALVREVRGAERVVGFLYGINALGAAFGAAVTPWLLVRHLGMRAALDVAAAVNVTVGLGALLLALLAVRGAAAAAGEEAGEEPTVAASREARQPFALWFALYATSGFCALSLEILWFRLIDVGVKSTAFTFGTVLCVYLTGLGLGTLAALPVARRLRRPLAAFLALQCGLLAYAGVAALVLVQLPPDTPFFRWFFDLWGGRHSYNLGGAWRWEPVLKLYLLLPVTLFGPPTLMMGAAFTVLQRAVQDDVRQSGRKVGILQAGNILGCVAGSLLVGLAGLGGLGTSGSLRALLSCGVALALLGAALFPPLRARFAIAAAALAALVVVAPGNEALWLRMHGMVQPGALIAEDASGVVAISREADHYQVWVNGRSHSLLPFGGIHTALGALPAIVHPFPRQAAIIGLGSGDTAWAAGCRRRTERIVVYEICAPQLGLLQRLSARDPQVDRLAAFLGDPRFEHRIADGRNALLRAGADFDVIEMDALPPSSPYAGNLYSVEFFRLAASRLREGGLMSTWAPTARTRASFAAAFPHVLATEDGQVLIGSRQPIPLDHEGWERRALSPAVVDYIGLKRAEELAALVRELRLLDPAAAGGERNTDLDPRDEFAAR
jgi:spermidine synthase